MKKTLSTLLIAAILIGWYSSAAEWNGYPVVKPADNIQPTMQMPMPMTESIADKDARVQPVYPTITYAFDEQAAKNTLAQSSLILELKCNGKAVLAAMGLGDNIGQQLLSIWYAEGEYEYNFDFRACSLWGNKPTSNRQNTTSITDQQALAIAKTFIQSGKLGNKVFNALGEPTIVSKYNNGWYYPMPIDTMREGPTMSSSMIKIDGIDIDESNPIKIDTEFTNYSIVFPYNIGWKSLYNQRWGKAGITVEVTSEWVVSFSAQLLPFTAARRDADKLSGDELVGFIKKWANNPYRGQTAEVKLNAPEKTLVLFNLRRNGKTELYLASGIRLWSDIKMDQRSQSNYEMIIADYRVGNPNIGY